MQEKEPKMVQAIETVRPKRYPEKIHSMETSVTLHSYTFDDTIIKLFLKPTC